MLKLKLEDLISVLENKQITVIDSPLYHVDFLKGVYRYAKKYEATFFGNYLHTPFYVSQKSGLIYCHLYANSNYPLDFALSSFMCMFHLTDDVTEFIPQDINNISILENEPIDFAPFTYTSVIESAKESRTLTVNSPVLSLEYQSKDELINSVPCKRKRNKLRKVEKDFEESTTTVVQPELHTSIILDWLFQRRGFTQDPIDFCVAMEAYLAVEIINELNTQGINCGMKAFILRHKKHISSCSVNFGSGHITSCYSYAVIDEKRKTSIYMGMAQNPDFRLDNVGLYALLEQAEVSRTLFGCTEYDPTCVTQPFNPQSIDVYKRGLYNQHRDVNLLLVTHGKDVVQLYPPYYHLGDKTWVTEGYDPTISMSDFK